MKMRVFLFALFTLLILVNIGCASKPNQSDRLAYATYQEANDPLEPLNRYFFELTRFADFLFLYPLSEVYKNLVPKYPREMLNNFYSNLGEPLDLTNNLLQGSFDRAGTNLGRLFVNSTIGILGFFDAAEYFFDWEPAPEDFGQTLAVYGMPEGPFLVIPFVGPSSFRDTIGFGLNIVGNPLRYVGYIPIIDNQVDNFQRNSDLLLQGRTPIRALEASSSSRRFINQIERESVDFYATVRELYRQNRRNAILNGVLDFDDLPEIPDDDFFEEEDDDDDDIQ